MKCPFKILTATLVLSVATLATPAVQAAPFVIDDFNVPFDPNPIVTNSGTSTPQTQSILAGTADRTTTINVVINGTGSTLTEIDDQMLSHQDPAQQQSTLTLLYDNFGTRDLTGLAIQLPISSYNDGTNDLPTLVTVTLTDTGLNTLTDSALLSAAGTLVFDSFMGAGNISQIQSIQFLFEPQDGESLALGTGFVIDAADGGFSTIQQVIPEPASLALWGVVGLTGAWYGRRRLKAQQAA